MSEDDPFQEVAEEVRVTKSALSVLLVAVGAVLVIRSAGIEIDLNTEEGRATAEKAVDGFMGFAVIVANKLQMAGVSEPEAVASLVKQFLM